MHINRDVKCHDVLVCRAEKIWREVSKKKFWHMLFALLLSSFQQQSEKMVTNISTWKQKQRRLWKKMKTQAADYESSHLDAGIMATDCDGLVKIASSTAMKVHPYLFACLFVCTVCLYIFLSFCPSVCISVCLFVYKDRNGKV